MKTLELLPTKANIINTYICNSIDRNNVLHHFLDLLFSVDENCSIALDGQWGTGKTFFIKQAKMVLDSFNSNLTEYTNEQKEFIRNKYITYLESTTSKFDLIPIVTIYFDAWKCDNDEDPLLSIIYEILQNVCSAYNFSNGIDFVNLFTGIGELITNLKLKNIVDSLRKSKDPLNELKNTRSLKAKIDEFLNSILNESGNRIVIFIDELDRCKPSYAISLLEKIKHYFDNEKITFIFAINAIELNKSISHFYGDNFNANKYLDRFFDLRISLPKANTERYFDTTLLCNDNKQYFYQIAKAAINTYNFELREIAKYTFFIKLAAKEFLENEITVSYYYDESVTKAFCINLIIPILIALKMYDINLYYDFIEGKNPKPLLDIITLKRFTYKLCEPLLDDNEDYRLNLTDTRYKFVEINDKLVQFYNLLFQKDARKKSGSIGELEITDSISNFVIEAANMLSDLTYFISSEENDDGQA